MRKEQRAFDAERFQSRLQDGLACMEKVLGNQSKIDAADNVAHSYEDKFALSEFLVHSFISAQVNCLKAIGFTEDHFKQLRTWSEDNQSITIALQSSETCSYLVKRTKKPDTETKQVTTVKARGIRAKFTSGISSKIVEYLWSFVVNYTIVAYPSTKTEESIVIKKRKSKGEIVTSSSQKPRPDTIVCPPIECNMTWLFQHIDNHMTSQFSIERKSQNCFTPYRNSQMSSAVVHCLNVTAWTDAVQKYFLNLPGSREGLDMESIHGAKLFCPVQSVFVVPNKENDKEKSPLVIPNDLELLLKEQVRSIEEYEAKNNIAFPEKGNILCAPEANLILYVTHFCELAEHFYDSSLFIEEMIKKQLISAIGKVVTPNDFREYMNFHHRKLFLKKFQPSPFTYAVQKEGNHPQGTVGIEKCEEKCEENSSGALPTPISTITRKLDNPPQMTFQLDAGCTVSMCGDTYVHGWIDAKFSNDIEAKLNLIARSGPYASYILMVGSIIGVDKFLPKYAVIVQSKDIEYCIPLLLEDIPSPQTFRDATESLPEEMKAFCKAYRAMQLESTLFGINIIQIKPQLEVLLNLPEDSLTKEIELTEKIQELFITYQIPSDLISYDGKMDASVPSQIARVKYLVQEMNVMISEMKSSDLAEITLDALYSKPPKKNPVGKPNSYFDGGDYEIKKTGKTNRMKSKNKKSSPSGPFNFIRRLTSPRLNKSYESEPHYYHDSMGCEEVDVIDDVNPHNRAQHVSTLCFDGHDVTAVPGLLDRNFEAQDPEGALRAATISACPNDWRRTSQRSFLADPKTETLTTEMIKIEKNRAFDLLDALSKSGIVPIIKSNFHVFLAASHSFDDFLMDLLIKKNVNPIQRVERSALIFANSLFASCTEDIIQKERLAAIRKHSPQLNYSQNQSPSDDEEIIAKEEPLATAKGEVEGAV